METKDRGLRLLSAMGADKPSTREQRLMAFMQDHAFAEDGGLGSGNWGHRGRPGKRGGSGKGGGKQYRGGRSDIAYFSSRGDWLNGLSGETQKEASKYLEGVKRWHGQGNKPVDQTIMEIPIKGKFGANGNQIRAHYLDFVSEARGWNENAKKLTDENWTDEDRMLAGALAYKYSISGIKGVMLPDDTNTDSWDEEDLRCWQDLKSKAMGGPTSGLEAPDELQYQAGTKERPKPKLPGADFSWYDNSRGNGAGAYMSSTLGESQWGHKYTAEEMKTLNQRFVDRIKYGSPSPNELSYYGMHAIDSLRNALAEPDPNNKYMIIPFSYTQEHFDRLDAAEKDKLLNILNMYSGRFAGFSDLSEVKTEDILKTERLMMQQTPRSNAQKQPFRDYILLQEKMLLGAEPSDHDTEAEQRAKAKADAEAKKAAQKAAAAKEREEASKKWKATHTPEEIQKMYHPDTINGVSRNKTGDMSFDEADHQSANPNYRKGSQYRKNCQTCVVAYEARLRGYDVEATGNPDNYMSYQSQLSRNTNLAWIDPETGLHPEYIRPEKPLRTTKQTVSWLEKAVEPGKRYTFEVTWKKSTTGHIVSMEKDENGNLRLYDPQTGKLYTRDGIIGTDGAKIPKYIDKDAQGKLVNLSSSYDGIMDFLSNATLAAEKESRNPQLLRVDNCLFDMEFANNILQRRGGNA